MQFTCIHSCNPCFKIRVIPNGRNKVYIAPVTNNCVKKTSVLLLKLLNNESYRNLCGF